MKKTCNKSERVILIALFVNTYISEHNLTIIILNHTSMESLSFYNKNKTLKTKYKLNYNILKMVNIFSNKQYFYISLAKSTLTAR